MRAGEAAVVGSGLLGLYLLGMSVFELAYLVQALSSPNASRFLPGGELGTIMTLGLGVIAGLCLLLGRRWVASRLLSGGDVDATPGSGAWRTGLALLGIYFVVRGVESMLHAVAMALVGAIRVDWPVVVPGAWLFLAGVVLLVVTGRGALRAGDAQSGGDA